MKGSKSGHTTLAQWGARVIRWSFTHIHVSRSSHFAVNNLTGDAPRRASQMRAILRCVRYGYLLAFHILLLGAAGRNPSEILAFLFCSHCSVYRIVYTY